MSKAIMWFRRDLRLTDQPALEAAVAGFEEVIPIFVWDDLLLSNSGVPRLSFLAGCLADLNASLGGALVQRRGNPLQIVANVAEQIDAEVVFCTEDFGPYGRRRDTAVGGALRASGRQLRAIGSPYAVEPGTVRNGTGGPFQVFTPFSRVWRAAGWAAPGGKVDRSALTTGGAHNDPPPPPPPAVADRLSAWPEPGEAAAHSRLERFLAGPVGRYGTDRDRPDVDGTSRLSPYLKFGVLHPRQILAGLDPGQRDHQKFESELAWREFYADVLFHRPDSARQSYRPEWRRFEVDEGPDADARFEAWAEGRTGYPIVDAGMRQLLGEGWVHNRVRMIVASFLVKDLHLDWRRGAQWFLRNLVDGDLASNHLGWQWVAGSGTDAAPYFRIFNPVAQGRKFDPNGDYVRRWVPELSGLDAEVIHEPWKSGSSLGSGPSLFDSGRAYPAPIVDHAVEREESLARYARLRSETT